jgi:hypothetical protein
VNETGSGSYPVAGFGIGDVEPSGSAIALFFKYQFYLRIKII